MAKQRQNKTLVALAKSLQEFGMYAGERYTPKSASEYIQNQYIIGNKIDARKLFNALDNSNKKQALEYMRETYTDSEVLDFVIFAFGA